MSYSTNWQTARPSITRESSRRRNSKSRMLDGPDRKMRKRKLPKGLADSQSAILAVTERKSSIEAGVEPRLKSGPDRRRQRRVNALEWNGVEVKQQTTTNGGAVITSLSTEEEGT